MPAFDEPGFEGSAGREKSTGLGRAGLGRNSAIGFAARGRVSEVPARREETQRLRAAKRGRPEDIGRRDASVNGARRRCDRAGSTRR